MELGKALGTASCVGHRECRVADAACVRNVQFSPTLRSFLL